MALVPKGFLDCVVAIGVPREEGEEGGPGWIATGFFYGRLLGVGEDGREQYGVYLISNRHVFEGLDRAVVRANPPAEDPAPARDYPLDLIDGDGEPLWFGHPDDEVDVAAIKVDYNRLKAEGMEVEFFANDKTALTAQAIRDAGITEGDFVYVLGYPMALVGEHRAVVIVRNGSIARIRDALERPTETFLVDSTVFPGNSGGPVVIRPEAIALQETVAPARAALIGIVAAYAPYREVAVSAQTGIVRMVFEENSGLAAVHLIDTVDTCIEQDPLFAQFRLQYAATMPPEPSEPTTP